jgi:hypothetical protein
VIVEWVLSDVMLALQELVVDSIGKFLGCCRGIGWDQSGGQVLMARQSRGIPNEGCVMEGRRKRT